jgi:hypothetical protein
MNSSSTETIALPDSDRDSYKIKQENGRRRENKVHSLSPFLLFVSGGCCSVRVGRMLQREGEHR